MREGNSFRIRWALQHIIMTYTTETIESRERYVPRFTKDRLRGAVRAAYREVACSPKKTFHFIAGRPLANQLSYDEGLLAGIPEGAIASFAGVGNPFEVGPVVYGETILDIGCGSGMDALIAARLTGNEGTVIGVDMTNEMIANARRHALEIGAWNTRFTLGFAEKLPIGDESVDLIISNGVINLSPDKQTVFNEMHRVMAPGGRFQIADVLVEEPVPNHARDLIHLWTDCIAGGETMAPYLEMIRAAGFRHVEIVREYDVFRGAKVEERAMKYGARGYTVRGWK